MPKKKKVPSMPMTDMTRVMEARMMAGALVKPVTKDDARKEQSGNSDDGNESDFEHERILTGLHADANIARCGVIRRIVEDASREKR